MIRRWRCSNPACAHVTGDADRAAVPCDFDLPGDTCCGGRYTPVALHCGAGQHEVFALAISSDLTGPVCPHCLAADEIGATEAVTVRVERISDEAIARSWWRDLAMTTGADAGGGW